MISPLRPEANFPLSKVGFSEVKLWPEPDRRFELHQNITCAGNNGGHQEEAKDARHDFTEGRQLGYPLWLYAD